MKNDSDVFGAPMPNRRLIRLLAGIAILNVLHLVDHIPRGIFTGRSMSSRSDFSLWGPSFQEEWGSVCGCIELVE